MTVRIGVLGVGRIGRMHADIIANETDGAEVAAVFDVNDAAAAQVADALRVPVMSIDEILESDSVDAVAICSSTDTHVELITRAAAAGKAIFCEKPISLDISEVDKALSAVREHGVAFMVGFNRRFDPTHAAVQEAVASGRVGGVQMRSICNIVLNTATPRCLWTGATSVLAGRGWNLSS